MIDVRLLRTDLAGVQAAMARRQKPELVSDLAVAARLDERLRNLAAERDELRRSVNELSKQVGRLRGHGQVA
jgi:seryl-tRNA synthetase